MLALIYSLSYFVHSLVSTNIFMFCSEFRIAIHRNVDHDGAYSAIPDTGLPLVRWKYFYHNTIFDYIIAIYALFFLSDYILVVHKEESSFKVVKIYSLFLFFFFLFNEFLLETPATASEIVSPSHRLIFPRLRDLASWRQFITLCY